MFVRNVGGDVCFLEELRKGGGSACFGRERASQGVIGGGRGGGNKKVSVLKLGRVHIERALARAREGEIWREKKRKGEEDGEWNREREKRGGEGGGGCKANRQETFS